MAENENLNLDYLITIEEKEIDSPKVKEYIKKEIQKITTHIDTLGKKIEESKKEAETAQNQKSGLFGKTAKKADMIANALVKNAEADSEMHTLVQQVIKFSCLSTFAYHNIVQELNDIMENGFKNSDGDIIHLNNTSKELAESVIYSVQEANQTNEKHIELENKSDKNDEKHDRQISELYQKIKELEEKKYNLLSIISIAISFVAIFLVLFK
ncbi:hypothetical protein OZY48_07915 [Aliarcobacter cryaerophilus]|uniref:hypothetical protein n=1 Tax=Aliarcobacter cryaerophilus TaxID=28198 RepID=UPI003BB0A49F